MLTDVERSQEKGNARTDDSLEDMDATSTHEHDPIVKLALLPWRVLESKTFIPSSFLEDLQASTVFWNSSISWSDKRGSMTLQTRTSTVS
jgi:hypothetical protein